MKLNVVCIICLERKQCVKPCSCSARLCIKCLLKTCVENDLAKCPQCRAILNKEEFAVPSMETISIRYLTNSMERLFATLNREYSSISIISQLLNFQEKWFAHFLDFQRELIVNIDNQRQLMIDAENEQESHDELRDELNNEEVACIRCSQICHERINWGNYATLPNVPLCTSCYNDVNS